MPTYALNPYVSFIESRLFAEFVQHAVFHRLTGEIFEPNESVRVQLLKRDTIALNGLDVSDDGVQLRQLIQNGFLIPEGFDPLTPLLDQYVTRPIQNPAVAYRLDNGEWILVRTSMEQTVYSPKRDELPVIVEEKLSPLAAQIFLQADGSRKLREIYSDDSEFREALDFLTAQERQLIKFTPRLADVCHPFTYVNIVPRNLYHSERKDQPRPASDNEIIIDFHLHGIEDASWEFDLIEPTVNHSFRFPHEALGGLDYGSHFAIAALRPELVPLMNDASRLEVLEVGGGTGSFASSFIKQARVDGVSLNYHILDLAPALMENQQKMLRELLPASQHFQQDATAFDLPEHNFDLIVSNEVIADFPVARVERKSATEFAGDGAHYVEKYELPVSDAPASFFVNAGVFRFIERAWKHLKPGGTLIVSEYGATDRYPAASFNLNHDEFTIHFGHVAACAMKVGFRCALVTLKQFLDIQDDVPVLSGREEHLLCLNHVLKDHGVTLPFAVISKSDFERRCGSILEQTGLIGYSFSPLSQGYHFGPNIRDFFVLIMNKPQP